MASLIYILDKYITFTHNSVSNHLFRTGAAWVDCPLKTSTTIDTWVALDNITKVCLMVTEVTSLYHITITGYQTEPIYSNKIKI